MNRASFVSHAVPWSFKCLRRPSERWVSILYSWLWHDEGPWYESESSSFQSIPPPPMVFGTSIGKDFESVKRSRKTGRTTLCFRLLCASLWESRLFVIPLHQDDKHLGIGQQMVGTSVLVRSFVESAPDLPVCMTMEARAPQGLRPTVGLGGTAASLGCKQFSVNITKKSVFWHIRFGPRNCSKKNNFPNLITACV